MAEVKFPTGDTKTTLFVLVLIVAIGFSTYFFIQYQKTKKLLQNPNQASQQEVKSLVDKVGRLIALPKDETPTVATVTDNSKLKNQPFFARSENGDKVLIYTKAKRAILYRPSTDKIIEVAPVTIGPNRSTTPTQTQTKIAIYNGTSTVGLGGQIEDRIKGKFKNIQVTDVANAKKNDYEKTLVVDLTGKNKSLVSEIAKFLSGEATSFPPGETKPDADIVVIAGE